MTQSDEPLSPLALAQLRLDVEAAASEARSLTNGPVDLEFFDPFELDEDDLEEAMVRREFPGDFREMRRRAAAKFPVRGAPTIGVRAQWLEDRHKRHNWLGMKGVFANAANFLESKVLGEEGCEQFAAAVGLSKGSPERALIDLIAHRLSKVRSTMGVYEYAYWSQFAVATMLTGDRFELMLKVALDMALMSADELVKALQEESLEARMKRKAESGGEPSVIYNVKDFCDRLNLPQEEKESLHSSCTQS